MSAAEQSGAGKPAEDAVHLTITLTRTQFLWILGLSGGKRRTVGDRILEIVEAARLAAEQAPTGQGTVIPIRRTSGGR